MPKIVKLLVLVLAVIAGLLYILMVKSGDVKTQNAYIDNLLNLTVALLYVTAILAVLGWIMDIFASKKSMVYTLISFGVFLVIVLLAYSQASDKPFTVGGIEYSGTVSKWSDTGLYTFYILAVIAVVLMVFTSLFSGISLGGNKKTVLAEGEEVEAGEEPEEESDEE